MILLDYLTKRLVKAIFWDFTNWFLLIKTASNWQSYYSKVPIIRAGPIYYMYCLEIFPWFSFIRTVRSQFLFFYYMKNWKFGFKFIFGWKFVFFNFVNLNGVAISLRLILFPFHSTSVCNLWCMKPAATAHNQGFRSAPVWSSEKINVWIGHKNLHMRPFFVDFEGRHFFRMSPIKKMENIFWFDPRNIENKDVFVSRYHYI